MPVAVGERVILRDLVARARSELEAAGVRDAHLDARLLVCAAADADHADLIARGDRTVPGGAESLALEFVARRVGGEPVSRILGRREFWSLQFEITPATLDPRADTETAVQAVLDLAVVSNWRERPLRICDLGTGSGCLLIALLRELATASGVGVDISGDALAVARRNAAAHDVAGRAEFVQADWTRGLTGPFDLVVANPPYIPSRNIAALDREVRDHDPGVALDGGPDGLNAYRVIVEGARRLLAEDGWLVLEVGAGQADTVRGLMTDAGFAADRRVPSVVRDLAGRERCVRAVSR